MWVVWLGTVTTLQYRIPSAGILPTQGQGALSCGTAAGFFSGEILQSGQDIPARPDLRFSVDQEVILSPIPLSTS
jgi:hypothetical protein